MLSSSARILFPGGEGGKHHLEFLVIDGSVLFTVLLKRSVTGGRIQLALSFDKMA